MKKIIALLMALVMLCSLVACSADKKEEDDKKETIGTTEKDENKDEDKTDGKTVGETLLAEFEKDSSGTAQEIAERIVGNKIIPFMGGAMPVEEGFLSGFDNAEIKGFKEGSSFGPMMGSIAFIGYIFELDEDTDVDAFKKELKENANLRWNICVEAEELIVENKDNKVFFLMCPKDFEQPETETDDGVGDMELSTEDMIPAEDGNTLG